MHTRKEAIALVKAARHVYVYMSLNDGDESRPVQAVKSSAMRILKTCCITTKFDIDQVKTGKNTFDLYIM